MATSCPKKAWNAVRARDPGKADLSGFPNPTGLRPGRPCGVRPRLRLGEIIFHTLPLTLTDRLWTGMGDTEHRIRDATIGLYQTAAGWYDPYSTQGIHAGGGSYVRARAGNWLADLIREQGQTALVKAMLSMDHRIGNLRVLEFLFENDLDYDYAIGCLSNSRWTLDTLERSLAEGKLGADLIDLGGGVLVDAGWGVLFDLPMLLQGEWTAQEYIGRMGVRVLGSGVSWVAGWGTKWLLIKWFAMTAGAAAPWILAVTITTDLVWGWWLEPKVYEWYPNLYPKRERIGPAEELPW